MKYRVYGDDYVIVMEKGEEILQVLTEVCRREQILLGTVTGIGAVGEVTLGVCNTEKCGYESRTYTGDFEIASCSGNISTMDGKTYLHIHMAAGNTEKGQCHGGHLNRGVISLTGEFFVHRIHGAVDREYSPEIGLNLIKFIDDFENKA